MTSIFHSPRSTPAMSRTLIRRPGINSACAGAPVVWDSGAPLGVLLQFRGQLPREREGLWFQRREVFGDGHHLHAG